MTNKKIPLSGSRRLKEYVTSKIIELRESIGWSQSELARRIGVTSAAISQIEKGDRIPSLIVIIKISEAFNVSLLDLTDDSTDSSKEINSEAQAFFTKFGDIAYLNAVDQKIITILIKRLRK